MPDTQVAAENDDVLTCVKRARASAGLQGPPAVSRAATAHAAAILLRRCHQSG